MSSHRPLISVVLLVGAFALGLVVAPAAFARGVAIVDSCDQQPVAGHYSCFAERRADLGYRSNAQVAADDATPSGFGPADLQSAYALASAAEDGNGRRVYVVDAYNDPSAESDLAVYRSEYGLPACTTANGCFRKVNQQGATSPLPATDTGWAGEISLDLDMVSAICPHCGITLVESADDGDNLFTGVKEATALGAQFVSMSWGGGETRNERNYDSEYFSATGVVYAAASGDGAYAAGASYPATSPDVVSVGGTSLTRDTGTSRGWAESVWYDRSGGTDSGCSSVENKPAWQSAIPSATCSRRADNDVSAIADPTTGVAVYSTTGGNGWAVYGGTSAAAPIIAATYALAGSPTGDEQPASLPYLHTAALNDVIDGSNGTCSAAALCTAGTGWDGPTGNGTPSGTAAFSPSTTSATTSLSTSAYPAAPTTGNAVRLAVTARSNSSSGSVDGAGVEITGTEPGGATFTQQATVSGGTAITYLPKLDAGSTSLNVYYSGTATTAAASTSTTVSVSKVSPTFDATTSPSPLKASQSKQGHINVTLSTPGVDATGTLARLYFGAKLISQTYLSAQRATFGIYTALSPGVHQFQLRTASTSKLNALVQNFRISVATG